jgi:DNA (cytosine-5)-methyltransferase 1
MAEYLHNTMEQDNLTVLDLFCGAGGISLGFERAGFRVLLAVDNNPAALKTYVRNLGHHASAHDLSQEIGLPNATVIVGGPPCQGFSSAGLRRNGDNRNNLVSSFAETVARMKPKTFLFENVEGFLTAEDGMRVLELLSPLLRAGYRIHLKKVNAANYGVPQHRKRVIAIGGLGWDPTFPAPTHTAFGAPGALLHARHLPLAPTLREAIGDLAPPSERPPGEPQGHYYRPLIGKDFERAKAMGPGMKMRDLPDELQHESYQRRAFRRVMDGTPSERRGGAPAGLRRLLPDEPSKAITGGARSEFLHPLEDRPLTIRECARLQTFPDNFVFVGSPSDQAQLIGNAVPPLFAYLIASTMAADLRKAECSIGEGALLSFLPTLSDGCSPALKRVIDLVNTEFEQFAVREELPLWR